MSLTGYIAKNGNDLSFIFQSGNSGLTIGYKLIDGRDIGSIFSGYTSYLSPLSGIISSNGSDISTLFNGNSYIPLTIPGCCIWLDAADINTITKDGNNKVSDWRDKSTSAYTFSQITGTNKPTYSTNSQNGNATISFTSANATYLSCSSLLAIGTSSFALFTVGRYSDNTTNMTIFAKSRFTSQEGRFFINRDASSLNIAFVHTGGALLQGTSESYSPVGGYRMFELIVNRTEQKDYSYQNGTQLQSSTISDSTNYADNGNTMLVGAYNNNVGTGIQSGYYLNGNVSEIIAYKSSDMTVANRQKIEGYLAWKWGIQSRLPVGHPYLSAPPI